MTKLIRNKFVQGLFVALALIATPAVASAASFNTASNDLTTTAVLNATQNPNSNTAWGPSTTARGGDMVTVEIYYHNSGTDAAQNTILRMNVPNGPQSSVTISGSVSASNANTASGSSIITFSDGQQHTLTYAGSMRWYPDQNSLHNNSPRPLLNGQSGSEVFSQGLQVGTVPIDNPNSAPGQAWNFSQGTLDVDFIVSQTVAPQASLTATTNPASGLTQNSAMLNGSVNGTNVTNVTRWFEWGTTQSLGQSTSQQFGQGSYSDSVFNLQPNTTYYFRAAARSNETNTVYGSIMTFQTVGNPAVCPATAFTNQPTNITQTGASFTGTVSPTPAGSYTNWFEYGTTPSFGQSTFQQSGNGAGFSGSVFSLTSNTTYFVRANVRSNDFACNNQIIIGNTVQFQTQPVIQQSSLVATTNSATGATQNSAMLNGSANGTNVTNVTRWFEYGTTFALGQSTSQQFGQGSYSDSVFNLQPNTTYYFRAAGRSNETNTVYGSILTFQTQPITQTSSLVATTNSASGMTQNSAVLNGTDTGTNVTNVTRWFEYGTTFALGQSTSQQFGQGSYSDSIFNLQPNTTYYFRAASRSNETGTVYGSILTFQSGQVSAVCPTSVFTNQPTNITLNSASLSGTVSPTPAGSYTNWFEYGTTAAFGQSTVQQGGSGASFAGFLNSLLPNTTYFVRANVRSTDVNCTANTIFGNTLSFQTNFQQQNNSTLAATTQSASGISQNGMTFNGYVAGTNTTNMNEWFEYGTTMSLGQTTYQQYASNGNYSSQAYNLQPATNYYFRAVARSNETGTVYGAILTAQTLGTTYYNNYQQTATLSATTNTATGISTNGATLNGSIYNNGATNVTRWFEYGTTQSLGQQTSQQYQSYASGNYSDNIYGLQSGVLYYFRAAARSNETGTVYGSIVPFSTTGLVTQTYFQFQPPVQPTVATNPAINITTSSARLNASAVMNNVQANGWFEWGTTPSLGRTTLQLNLGSGVSNGYYTTVTGLSAHTLYYFRAVTQNTQGQTARGQILSFTTLTPAVTYVPPKIITPPAPKVTVAVANYVPVKSGEVITKTVDDISFPCGTKTYVCAREGHTIQYTITVMNPSWSATSNAVITDTLAPILAFKNASEGGTYNAGTRMVQWSRQLGPREGHTFMIQVLARDIADNIVVTNNAQIYVNGKTYASNDTQVCITITPIKLEITADKANVAPGDNITYTVRYSNVDGAPVQNLNLRMSVPQGTTFVSSDHQNIQTQNGMVNLTVGGLNPKQDGTISLALKVDSKVNKDQPITFTANASFQDTQGVQQPDVLATVNTPISAESTKLNTASAVSVGSFLPSSLLGWLAFILLFLIIILIITRILSDYKGGKGHPPATV
ncbi:MAG: hypothetical protein WC764_02510 [Candidatus Paceibacterota bacterium]